MRLFHWPNRQALHSALRDFLFATFSLALWMAFFLLLLRGVQT